MSHRLNEKQARRAARLRAEAEAQSKETRQRLMRRAGFGVVGVIAVTLVTLAVVLGGEKAPSKDPMGSAHSSLTHASGAVVGAPAPDFALTDVVSGRQVSLAGLKGKRTMLFFSEGVNCQACMVQAADLQKNSTLRSAGIRLVSVSTDQPGDLAAAAEQYGIRSAMLADPTTQMSAAYGMLGHGGMGHPTQDGHAFILLGADGKVQWHRAYQEMYVKPQQLVRDMKAQAHA